MTTLTIRAATPDDAPLPARLLSLFGGTAATLAQVAARVRCLLARVDNPSV